MDGRGHAAAREPDPAARRRHARPAGGPPVSGHAGCVFPVGGADRPVPEFRYRGWYNGLGLLDFGPRFDEADESGIADWLPPAYLGKDYAILVSAVDGDGNEAAGVQPVGNRAPLGTNLPYNYDADPEVRDLAGLLGAFIPFHRTKAGRIAAGDGRPSLEERYGTHAGYVAAVRDAADALLQAGFLLPDDRDRIVAAGGGERRAAIGHPGRPGGAPRATEADDSMLATLGLLTILALLAAVLTRRMSPLVALIAVPTAASLLGGFGAKTGAFIVGGIREVAPVAGMFVFAILYFGIMADAGLLDPIIDRILLRRRRPADPDHPRDGAAWRCWSTSTAPGR